jgi:DNA polymerase-3 subunit beta
MVGTDGRRLSYCAKEMSNPIPDFKGVIIPPKVLGVVQKRAGDEGMIDLAMSDNMIFIKFGSYELSSVLIDGQFPNYKRVIPEGQTNSLTLKAGEFMDALRRVSILVEQKTRRIYLVISQKGVQVKSEESDIGDADEEIECQYQGENTTIALNYRYIEEPLKALGTEDVQIQFTNPSKPLTVKPVPESDYFHVIMPMQLD